MTRSICLSLLLLVFFQSFSFADEEMTLGLLLERYREATAPRTVLNRLKSMRIKGEIVTPSSKYEFVSLKKRPNLVKTCYKMNNTEIVKAYDGKFAWGKNGTLLVDIDGTEKEAILRGAQIEFFLYNHEDYNCTVTYEGMKLSKLGEDCHLVKSVFNDSLTVWVYIHPETYAMTQQDEVIVNGDKLNKTTSVLSEFTVIDGISFALKMENFVKGKKLNTIHIIDVEQNIGVLSSSFKKPQ